MQTPWTTGFVPSIPTFLLSFFSFPQHPRISSHFSHFLHTHLSPLTFLMNSLHTLVSPLTFLIPSTPTSLFSLFSFPHHPRLSSHFSHSLHTHISPLSFSLHPRPIFSLWSFPPRPRLSLHNSDTTTPREDFPHQNFDNLTQALANLKKSTQNIARRYTPVYI